jgi:SWI/SNF-related matrix-associated actin-dependent regulator of chromatin subfamily A3
MEDQPSILPDDEPQVQLDIQPEVVAEPSIPSLPQQTQDSIDLTGDSDDGNDHTPTGVDAPSRPAPNGVQVGLNGFSGGPSVMNGNRNGNGHAQAGPSTPQQSYPSFYSKGPLRTPSFGSPSFSTHPPNGQGNIHPPPNYFQTSFQSNVNLSNNTNGSHFQNPYNQSSNIYSPRQPVAGPSNDGFSSSSAIDLTSNIPSPVIPHNPKKPIFMGAITTDLFMLYPSPIVYIGATSPDDKERLEVVQYRGAEFLKVKLKVCFPLENDQERG